MVDYLRDLESTCAALGTNDGAGSYHKDDDCLECVKDLIRFLRRDDGNNHTLRRALGQIGVVKSDLLPILREYSTDDDLFDMVLRLIVNLTSPELLLFRHELPEDKLTRNYFLELQRFRQEYKETCVDEKLWHILAQKLGGLLRKDYDERSEDDRLIIERILILVRNILEVPRDAASEKRTEDDATVHDNILWVLHKSGMEDLLLFVASSSEEAQYCLHVLEIISLIFREQDPKFLAAANYQRSTDERKEDEIALVRLRQQEEERKKQKYFQTKSTRHSRFGGSYTLRNVKSISENPLICHKPLSSLSNINFDENKRPKKISKNRETPKDENKRRSTLAIRLFLKEFCIEFLNGAYNQLMYVVKDNLNRQKAQQNDETYYLWAIKFFMEFNRIHNFRVELVTETMSKATFHYIHQQIEAYKDNYEHEKRNRPMCLTWARRMHLGIKAYQELLLNLVAMAQSKDESVKKSGIVLRTDVFYEQEYRELCLEQLNIYNETKMSVNYLKDLAETTHAFLKLMEAMSKGQPLVIKSKKKTKSAQKKKVGPLSSFDDAASVQENNEKVWEDISSQLSACLGGDANIPSDISPFDAASETPIDAQKLLAMSRIQDLIRERKAFPAVGLLRAARDVWPEQETFGANGADPEDEFMILREILFAEIPRPRNKDPISSEAHDEPNPLDNIEQEELGEEEYEDEYITRSTEQKFDFQSLATRFAVKSVCHAYALLFANYEKNSDYTNHCVVKMFHRIAWDCKLPALLFNISMFRTFQKIHKEYVINKIPSLKELDRFAKYLLSQFYATSKTNKKVFMELLFWKTARDASEILGGYGTHTTSTNNKASFWTEDEEETLERVFHQLKESTGQYNPTDHSSTEQDLLDSVTVHFTSSGKSRRQVARKLKALHLIKDIKEVTRKPLKVKGSVWSDEEIEKLKTLYEEYKSAFDPVSRIREHLPTQRTKRKITEKILELELCSDVSILKRKPNSLRRKRDGMHKIKNDSEPDSAFDSSSSGSEESESSDDDIKTSTDKETVLNIGSQSNVTFESKKNELIQIMTSFPKDMKPVFEWLKDTFEEVEEGLNNKEEDDNDPVPLLAITDQCVLAIESDSFQKFLRILQIEPPGKSGSAQYWSISSNETRQSLTTKASLVDRIILQDGNIDLNDLDVELLLRPFNQKIKEKKKREEPRKNKWMPMRRNLDSEAQERIGSGVPVVKETSIARDKSSQTKKKLSKSVLKENSSEVKCNAKGERQRIQNKNHSESDDVNFTDHGTNNLNDLNGVDTTTSPNNTCGSTKKTRKKRLIINDSSSDEETLPSRNDVFPENTSEDNTTNLQSMPDSSDSEEAGTGNSLGAKRRILDDSSSDEGVIDPNPGDEPTSFLASTSSSPLRLTSTITSRNSTPTSQTSTSQTPMSKRCRDSSPELLSKKRRNLTDVE